MLATSSGVATAIGSNTYTMLVRAQITLPGNVLQDVSLSVESLSIDVTQTTDMPDGTRIESGYPAMTCDLTLSGAVVYSGTSYTAAALFSPYSTSSPLYRQSVLNCVVTVDVAVIGGTSTEANPEWLRKSTGTIDTLTVDPVAGTVELECIDYRNMLRSLPNLSPVIPSSPYNAGLTSEFAIDYLLRQATNYATSSWPAQRPSCVFAAGMRGSLWPEVGTLDTTNARALPTFAQGAFGSALSGFVTQPGNPPTALLASPVTSRLFCEFWVTGLDTVNSNGTLPQAGAAIYAGTAHNGFTVTAGNGTVGGLSDPFDPMVGISFNGVTNDEGSNAAYMPGTPSAGAHYVAVKATYSGGTWSGTMQFDSTVQSFSGATGTAPPFDHLQFWAVNGATIEAVQVSIESSPVANNTFTPQAQFDKSLNTLQVIPALSGDPWQVIQQIVDAEQAVAGFDESGIFRFTNRKTLKSSSSVRQVTSSTSLKSLQFSASQGSTYGSVTVPYDGWNFGTAGLLYTIKQAHSIPPHTTRSWTVTLPDGTLAAAVDNNASVLPQGHTTTDGNSWFRMSSDSGGLNEYLAVTVTLTVISPSKIQVTVTNTGNKRAYTIAPAATANGGTYTDIAAGTPSLWIGGQPVTQADEMTTTFTVNPALPALTLDSNPWIQDDDTAAQLAFDLADDLSVAKPDLTNISIVPDPRLQLGDRIEIVDPVTSGIDEYATLWGWSLSLSDSDWSMTVDARAVAAPGQWILGVTGRTELGLTTFID
jgi:hypothetical protein